MGIVWSGSHITNVFSCRRWKQNFNDKLIECLDNWAITESITISGIDKARLIPHYEVRVRSNDILKTQEIVVCLKCQKCVKLFVERAVTLCTCAISIYLYLYIYKRHWHCYKVLSRLFRSFYSYVFLRFHCQSDPLTLVFTRHIASFSQITCLIWSLDYLDTHVSLWHRTIIPVGFLFFSCIENQLKSLSF